MQILRTTYGLDDFGVGLPAPLDMTLPPGSVVVRVGDFTHAMALTMAGQRLLTTGYNWEEFIAAFGESDRFEILVAGELHSIVPLTGSAAALVRLDECVARAYDGPVAPTVPSLRKPKG
ncbi:MAG: hypothetical protein WBA68_04980 [Alteraurantiacibacter sp.]